MYAINMGYKCTLEEAEQSEAFQSPKSKGPITKKSEVIYRYKCDRVDCDEEYIGESSITFGERFNEHLKAPSPKYGHCNITGHTTRIDNFSLMGGRIRTSLEPSKKQYT